MDYLDLMDEQMSYEEKICQAEFYAECQRENEQLKRMEEKENERYTRK